MSEGNKKPIIIGLGEIVWDMLPGGKQLGGAPVNFAYFAMRLGAESYPMSAVGNDRLGDETLERCCEYGINTAYIRRNGLPTSRVLVTVDVSGVPQYEIVEGVAWDGFSASEKDFALATKADCICWGSLAQRNAEASRNILAVVDATGKDCLKVFDINIRQHYYSPEVVEASLERADVLKLNEDELPLVLNLTGLGSVADIIAEYSLRYLVLTCGAAFSEVYDRAGLVSHLDTPRVKVADTVGAGDSFTATFVALLLQGLPVAHCHAKAIEISAKVCTFSGAINDFEI